MENNGGIWIDASKELPEKFADYATYQTNINFLSVAHFTTENKTTYKWWTDNFHCIWWLKPSSVVDNKDVDKLVEALEKVHSNLLVGNKNDANVIAFQALNEYNSKYGKDI